MVYLPEQLVFGHEVEYVAHEQVVVSLLLQELLEQSTADCQYESTHDPYFVAEWEMGRVVDGESVDPLGEEVAH